MSFDMRDLRTKGVIELTQSGKMAKLVLPNRKPLYFSVIAFKNMVYSRRIRSITVYERAGEDFKKNGV